jgi:shikimate dehydrogenase
MAAIPSKIRGSTKIVAVFGDPIAHSRSPELHNYWIAEAGVDAVYVPLRLSGADAAHTLSLLPSLGFTGANVTLPHKEAALAAATAATTSAKKIGAANTLAVDENGYLRASNTDAAGFVSALVAACPDWTPDRGPVCVLGAGGAARAIAVGLSEAGVGHIRIANRTLAKAEAVAKLVPEGNGRAFVWADIEEALSGAALVVNATSLGLAGKNPLALNLQLVSRDAIIVDTVYTPLETAFLGSARAQGFHCVDGLGMLIHQAALSFSTWFGIAPDTEAGRAFLMRNQ